MICIPRGNMGLSPAFHAQLSKRAAFVLDEVMLRTDSLFAMLPDGGASESKTHPFGDDAVLEWVCPLGGLGTQREKNSAR